MGERNRPDLVLRGFWLNQFRHPDRKLGFHMVWEEIPRWICG